MGLCSRLRTRFFSPHGDHLPVVGEIYIAGRLTSTSTQTAKVLDFIFKAGRAIEKRDTSTSAL